MLIGLISDTHGLLRPEVFEALEGVEHIVHAGDIGSADLLAELEAIAPVTAVWGNTDGFDVRARVPEAARVELAGVEIVVVHGHRLAAATAQEAAAAHPDADLVVFGHSHQPVAERFGRVLAVNPGSAGPRRFKLPVTLALARLEDGRVSVEHLSLIQEKRER